MPGMPASDRSNAALLAAIRALDVKEVARALKNGADPNSKDPVTFSPMVGVAIGITDDQVSEQIVSLLLSAGADPNAMTSNSRSLLHYAANNANPGAMALLIAAGADISKRHGDNRLSVLGALLTRDITANWSMRRIANKDEEAIPKVIRILAKAGADLSDWVCLQSKLKLRQPMSPEDRVCAVHLAANLGSLPALRTLADLGCPLDVRDSAGRTALHFGAEACSWQVCGYLLNAGIPFDVRDSNGLRPLDYVLPGANGSGELLAAFRAAEVRDMLRGYHRAHGKTAGHSPAPSMA